MRIGLYIVLLLSSFVLFGLTAARLHYTTHLPPGDPLNRGVPFYNPIVAELCAAALVTFFVAIFYTVTIAKRTEKKRFTRIWFESILLFIAFVLLVVGAAISTSIWPNLHFCRQFQPCRLLTAMVAFAWITTITTLILIISSAIYAIRFHAWTAHVHSHRGRRGREGSDSGTNISEGAITADEGPGASESETYREMRERREDYTV